MAKHRLTFFQKKLRSLTKRFLAAFVNQSDSFVVQHLPESTGHSPHPFSKLRSIWTHENQGNNNVDLVRLLFLQQTVEEILERNIPGAFAELGVYKGNSAKLFHELAPERKLYLFDTFSGFDAKDVLADPKRTIRKTSFLDTSLDQVRAFVGAAPQIQYCPGYFPASTTYLPDSERFAIAHLDADLYQPTLAALRYFTPRMSPGGVVILHDYSSGAWPGVKQAVDEFMKDQPFTLIRIPDKSGTAVFCPH